MLRAEADGVGRGLFRTAEGRHASAVVVRPRLDGVFELRIADLVRCRVVGHRLGVEHIVVTHVIAEAPEEREIVIREQETRLEVGEQEGAVEGEQVAPLHQARRRGDEVSLAFLCPVEQGVIHHQQRVRHRHAAFREEAHLAVQGEQGFVRAVEMEYRGVGADVPFPVRRAVEQRPGISEDEGIVQSVGLAAEEGLCTHESPVEHDIVRLPGDVVAVVIVQDLEGVEREIQPEDEEEGREKQQRPPQIASERVPVPMADVRGCLHPEGLRTGNR